jgi:hypothetical protein
LIDIETLLFGEEKSFAETNSILSSCKLKETVQGDGGRSRSCGGGLVTRRHRETRLRGKAVKRRARRLGGGGLSTA